MANRAIQAERHSAASDDREFSIDILYFRDDAVWLATSEDIKGLTVEANSYDVFLEALFDVSTELLTANHGLAEADIEDTTLRVKSLTLVHTQSGQRTKAFSPPRRPVPKVMLDAPIDVATAAA